MSDAPRRIIGLPWYRREDYPTIRQVMDDPYVLASTYEQWLSAAENNEAVGRQAGLEIVRVMIYPQEFRAWCLAQGMAPDGAARTKYASEHSLTERAGI
ncbi:hypothetical protein AB4Y85_10325 [Microvirga sp. 2YAF29]|uniref:hypothetical protein n=1 Tax=Microvirga sp. 2YAF29 TaxID=3233031 RepID=UPI003F958365